MTYAPAANYHGPDRFTYVVSDSGGLTANGTVTVTVTVTPMNDAPVAVGTIPDQVLDEGGDRGLQIEGCHLARPGFPRLPSQTGAARYTRPSGGSDGPLAAPEVDGTMHYQTVKGVVTIDVEQGNVAWTATARDRNRELIAKRMGVQRDAAIERLKDALNDKGFYQSLRREQ